MKRPNENYKRRYPGLSLSALRGKLMGATAMLLVAATLMATASYAWFVLSTAPEVTGINTQVGANGALEIALLNTTTYNDLSLLQDADFDEGVTADTVDTNLNWGNLVNLNSNKYGLDKITLMPSRLHINKNGNDFAIATTLLKTPKYGEDGRILGLETGTSYATFNQTKDQFSNANEYGVRAVGTASSMTVFQRQLNQAQAAIATSMAAARTAASRSLNSQGATLANIALKHAVGTNETYTKDDIQSMLALAQGMKTALNNIDAALRQVYVAYICSNMDTSVNEDTLVGTIATITDTNTTWAQLQNDYRGVETKYTQMTTYINKLTATTANVDNCIADCNTLLESNGEITWEHIYNTMAPLVKFDRMTLNGYTIDKLLEIKKNEGTEGVITAVVGNMSGSGILVTVPSGSGLLSDVADFAGDYSATVTVTGLKQLHEKMPLDELNVNMTTATTENPLHLTDCSTIIRGMEAKGATAAGNAITDYYGYALDLALRTNAPGKTKLMLQTDPMNRIYEGSNDNPDLQGGGSFMEFTSNANMSAAKMVRMMDAIRVVFMGRDNVVYSIAKLDCTLGKDVYRATTQAEKEQYENMPYVLDDTKTGVAVQYADCITEEQYNLLPGESAVTFTGDGKVKAQLYLYNFHKTTAGDDNHETGGLTIDEKKSAAEITELMENQPKLVTALVYMDGSFVHNSDVASNSAQSMTGKLNLQFSSSATLIPAVDTALQTKKSKDGETT